MTPKQKQQLILTMGLAGALTAASGTFVPVLGLVGGVIGAIALVLQYRLGSGPVVILFGRDDFQPDPEQPGERFLRIPFEKHGRRRPTVQVYVRQRSGELQEEGFGLATGGDGSVIVRCADDNALVAEGLKLGGEIRIS